MSRLAWQKACAFCKGKEVKEPSTGSAGSFIAIAGGISTVSGMVECLECGQVAFPIEIKEKKDKKVKQEKK